jgi:hypothetical protein
MPDALECSKGVSGAIKEMGVVVIEFEADRVGVSVILESLHIQSDPVPGRCGAVNQGQIAQVLDNLNQKGAGTAAWFADQDVFRSQPQGQFGT